MTLCLYPWRDGYEFTKKLLQEQQLTPTVQISFSEYEFKEYLQDADAIRLFELIGSNPKLESVTIELDVFSELPTYVAIPPIVALTSLLTQSGNQIRDLTLSQLQLESHNDLDINGMVEALRIHPTLQRVEVKNCTFTKPSHLHRLRKTLVQREGIKHCDLLNNRVSFSQQENGEEEKIDYEQYWQEEEEEEKEEWPVDEGDTGYNKKRQSFWRWGWKSLATKYPRCTKICLFCFSSVTAFLAARLLQQEPATTTPIWNHHDYYSLVVPHYFPFSISSFSASNRLLLQQPSSSSRKKVVSNHHQEPKSHPLLSGFTPWQYYLWTKEKDSSQHKAANGKQPLKKKKKKWNVKRNEE